MTHDLRLPHTHAEVLTQFANPSRTPALRAHPSSPGWRGIPAANCAPSPGLGRFLIISSLSAPSTDVIHLRKEHPIAFLNAPVGFALAAGTVAAFNPCGFAMLPAYLSFFISVGPTGVE